MRLRSPPPASYYAPYYNLGPLGGPADPFARSFEGDESETWTLEARLASNTDSDSRWGWLAGAFYNKHE